MITTPMIHPTRVKGQGSVGRHGGESGDLFVHFRVGAHDSIRRVGADLYSAVTVDYLDLILGTK